MKRVIQTKQEPAAIGPYYCQAIRPHTICFLCICMLLAGFASAQRVMFHGDFSPAEGLIISHEKPYRDEICLNGYWDVQPVAVPANWKEGTGIAPELPAPLPDMWESVRIKIPSPVNVNSWGAGRNVGEGSRFPYAPSSVYYPGYPKSWDDVRMVWLKKMVTVPAEWNDKRVVLHFEAVAGECVLVVNGIEVARHFDAWLPFTTDITRYLQKEAPNEILIGLRHTRLFDVKHPDYRYFGATYPSGSNTDNLIGIWQDVFIHAIPALHITDVFIKPWLNKNELEIEASVTNQSVKKIKVRLEGDVREWINNIKSDEAGILSSDEALKAAEIDWKSGNTAMTVSSNEIELKPGESQTIVIRTPVNDRLKKWSPDSPNLYTLLLQVKNKKTTFDCKATRFGWRQFTIEGKDFHLNGEKIQCFGDIQHPFGAYICSRRFAWAWYRMIKDFGGNAVRPHAQPWPRVYYDLADEMGLMVLDETALFGSSIRLNLEEEITWERSFEHLKQLVLRDRNHPSVIGWSAGNEMFAIALLNKPPEEVSAKWNKRLVELTLSIRKYDNTRDFITLDGDRDMDGQLPVWSKHFAHGLKLEDLPQNPDKPLIVGECGATYYGRPSQLYPFSGNNAFESYYGRNEALAVDIYQNVACMARPYLAYFSPSEVCWFGIEHLNLGYRDFSRLPDLTDGIFPSKPYQEGKPGYQYERIPPYVTTFNPGLDPDLPLYKPLPMFEAIKAALAMPAPQANAWDTYKEIPPFIPPDFPDAIYQIACFAGDENGALATFIRDKGIQISKETKTPNLLIIDAETISQQQLLVAKPVSDRIRKYGGLILVMTSGESDHLNPVLNDFLPATVKLTERRATALENNPQSTWGKFFTIPNLYFAEQEGDRFILKRGLSGDLVDKGTVVLHASRTDWSLFNNHPENRKCAQVVLYEQLEKPEAAALATCRFDNATLAISAIDYRLTTNETRTFWKHLFTTMKINTFDSLDTPPQIKQKQHNLLLDGPVD